MRARIHRPILHSSSPDATFPFLRRRGPSAAAERAHRVVVVVVRKIVNAFGDHQLGGEHTLSSTHTWVNDITSFATSATSVAKDVTRQALVGPEARHVVVEVGPDRNTLARAEASHVDLIKRSETLHVHHEHDDLHSCLGSLRRCRSIRRRRWERECPVGGNTKPESYDEQKFAYQMSIRADLLDGEDFAVPAQEGFPILNRCGATATRKGRVAARSLKESIV